ncbi:MAG: phasin family protein, partial [Acidobacteria bacterium]|nr:phasin family protein [Acidobacteriota bacterium]
MAKKKRKNVAEDALSIAQNVWLAGLGALATTQEEGGKLFKRLVEKGEKVDFKGKSGLDEKVDKAREKVGEARERIEGQVDKAREAVSSAWGDLASSFDDQLGAALHRLGVPTRDEIKTLTARVEALIEKVGEKQAPKAPAAKKPAAKKAAAKKPAAKKPAAK